MIRFIHHSVLLVFFLGVSSLDVQAEEHSKLIYQKESKTAIHRKYQEFRNLQPVFNSFQLNHQFKVKHLAERNVPILISKNTCSIELRQQGASVIEREKGYWKSEGKYLPVERILNLSGSGKYYEVFQGENQEISCHHRFVNKDTTIQVRVFNPNPVVSSGQVYGGGLVDNQDQNSVLLEAELFEKTIQVSFENGAVKSQYFSVEEFNDPVTQVPDTGVFLFNRSDSLFEVFNVYYHLNQLFSYVDSIGYSSLVDDELMVDVHGLSGEDNSLFQSVTAVRQIIFGDGGVDDAEDAEVIVHEAGHALTDAAAPGSNQGLERRAIDEGIADYLAASYSKSITGERHENIPSWDGHNEFWDGRTVASEKMYPGDITLNLYSDGEIWSNTMTRIEDSLGRDTTILLLLESAHYYHAEMGMLQAASYVKLADSLLFNAGHADILEKVFCDKGLGNDCDSASYYQGEVTVAYEAMLQRTLLFSKNYRQFSDFDVVNINGQVVHQQAIVQTQNLAFLPAGVYMVRLFGGAEEQVIKVVFP